MPELSNPGQETAANLVAAGSTVKDAVVAAGLTNGAGGKIRARAQEIVQTRFAKAGITAQRTMVELARVAYSNMKDLYDENGELIPLHEMDDDTAATITSIDIETFNSKDGNGSVTTKKIKRADKMAALSILAKHFKIVGDEGDGVNALASALADRLDAAHRRITRPQDIEDAKVVESPQVEAPVEPFKYPEERFDEEY